MFNPRGPALFCLAIVCALGSVAAAEPQPFPENDGLVYPGQPGSEGIAEYYKLFEKRGPRRPAGRLPAYRKVEWMAGRWKTSLRDYEYRPPAPGQILELATGTADIEFTPDDWWLKLDARSPGRNDLFLLGYDDVTRRWILYQLGRPGRAYGSALVAPDWTGDRITFGPADLVTASGLKLTDRVTIVRDGDDRFRIVTEALLPTGRFVAVHDRVFTRSK